MRGFRDEGALWDYMRPRMLGRWERVEVIHPEGMPDIFGTHGGYSHWIERKVGSSYSVRKMMEPGQIEFFDWLDKSTDDVGLWVVVGGDNNKSVTWFRWPDLDRPALPPFWEALYNRK